jgi:parallel beta-helix repeat protein
MEQITDLTLPAEHIIDTDGTYYYAYDGRSGKCIEYGTNAATVIQAAIDARTYAEMNHIFIRPGTYTLTEGLDLKGNLTFMGAGMQSTILRVTGGIQNFNILDWTPTTDEYFLTLRDFQVSGDGTDGTSGHCIFIDDVSGGISADCQIDHVFSTYGVDCGIRCDYNWGLRVTNCISEYSGDENLSIGTSIGAFVSNCFLAYSKGLYGVQFNSEGGLFHDNIVYLNQKCGVLLAGARKYQIVSGNVFYGNGTAAASDGLWVDGSNDYATIIGNEFKENTAYGIDLDADYCIVTGNTFYNNTSGMIDLAGAGNVINGAAKESANAETPQLVYPRGTICDFTDSGDGTGTGIYWLDQDGNWTAIA